MQSHMPCWIIQVIAIAGKCPLTKVWI